METGYFSRPPLEDAIRRLSSIHVPHFQHLSARSALFSDKLSAHAMEITMTLVILGGLLMALTFWAVVAR